MSGGSHNYICYQIEENLVGQMEDRELNDLMKDIVTLAHDLEWYHSADISRNGYRESVRKFKDKWFKQRREERLKKYIEESIQEIKEELLNMIGGENDERPSENKG